MRVRKWVVVEGSIVEVSRPQADARNMLSDTIDTRVEQKGSSDAR